MAVAPPKKGWGFCGSPLLDGEKLIVATGGPGGLITALEASTGKVLWRSEKVKDQATYGSVIGFECMGQPVYAVATQTGAVAVSAKDGSPVWRYQREAEYPDIVACTPVVVGEKLLLPVGHGGDCALLVFSSGAEGKIEVKPAWVAKEISNNHGGFVVSGDRVFGFHAKRAWTAQNLADGKVLWSGRRNALGSGNAILVDGKVIALAEMHQVTNHFSERRNRDPTAFGPAHEIAPFLIQFLEGGIGRPTYCQKTLAK